MLNLSFFLPRSWSIALILKEVLLFSYKQRRKFAPQWKMFVLSWLSVLVWIKISASVKIIYTDNLTCLQISIEGVRGSTFAGDIAVDSIEFTPGRCKLVFSEEEIQSDSHLALGNDLLLCYVYSGSSESTTAMNIHIKWISRILTPSVQSLVV